MASQSQDSYTDDGKTLKTVLNAPNLLITSKCETIFGASKELYACIQVASTLQSFSFQPNPQLKRIQNYAFYKCINLQTIDLSPCILLTYIGSYAFYSCESVTSLIFPNNLDEIDSFSFNGLTSLVSLFIPSSVSTIGSDCFAGCSKVSEITFGENSKLTAISTRIFSSCIISSLEIPPKVNSIKSVCFYKCTRIKTITVHLDNQNFKSDGYTVYTNNNRTLVYCASLVGSTFEVPNFVTRIDYSAFISSRVRTIVLPETITFIDQMAFGYNGYLTEINLPDSITYMGSYCFTSCGGLKAVTLPSKLKTIAANCFSNSGLTEIRIPENVTTIGDNAFSGCTSLMDVYLNEKLETIGGGVFSRCPPDMRYHFGENSQIKLNEQMLLMDNAETYISQYLGSDEKIINIPGTIEKIKRRAFYLKKNIVAIRCQTNCNIKYIYEEAFYGCTKLEEFNLFSNVIEIGFDCFFNTSLSGSISFSSALTSIGYDAFKNTKIESVSILSSSSSQSMRSFLSTPQLNIGNNAFEDCIELVEFNISNSISVSYGDYCFMNCKSLREFYLSNNVIIYGISCFMNSGLYNFTFENDISPIDNIPINCFKNCINLETFIIPSNIEVLNSQCFSGTSIRSIDIPINVKKLSIECFKDCINLERVVISNNSHLMNIEFGVFSGCERFSTIPYFKSEFMIVENGAMYSFDRSELYVFPPASPYSFLSLPDKLRSIGQSSFIGCKNLDSILIPDNLVRSIGKSAFAYCINLRMINIPSCIESIGSDAFIGCCRLHCGLSIQNRTKTFISTLISSGLPITCIRDCSSYTCRMIHYNKDLHLSYLFPIIIM